MGLINETLKTGARFFLAVEEHNDKELTEFRLSVCQSCDQFDREDRTCTVCGCFMDIKAPLRTNKTAVFGGKIEETHCPLGRWNDKETANLYRALAGKPLLQ